jgi:hypothetical protein
MVRIKVIITQPTHVRKFDKKKKSSRNTCREDKKNIHFRTMKVLLSLLSKGGTQVFKTVTGTVTINANKLTKTVAYRKNGQKVYEQNFN